MAALKQVKLSDVQSDGTYCNAASNHFVVDNALLASKYQLNDIIMTVDFIMQNIATSSLTRSRLLFSMCGDWWEYGNSTRSQPICQSTQ